MSNIYIQEPPTHGKVLLETTVGDIDIELWSREAPKAVRNFVQLCMEGYYDNTIFHRLVKGFIVQGGDPTGTGQGGTSIWGKTFKDEIHSRLRFVRRGLVAMANAGRDDNGSQFFFTLGTTPELQNKHTIFGKVGGDTIYNMIKLEDGMIDLDEKPLYPHKILRTRILSNPFDDIIPRQIIKPLSKEDKRKGQSSVSATKNFNLLSFGEEAEEEEEEVVALNRKFTGKSKSSHDLINDPKLSSVPALLAPDLVSTKDSSNDKESDTEPEKDGDAEDNEDVKNQLSYIKEKLKKKNEGKKLPTLSKTKKPEAEEEDDGEYYLGKEDKLAEAKRLEDIRKEYRNLKRSMKKEKEVKVEVENAEVKEAEEREAQLAKENSVIQSFLEEQKIYKERKTVSKKGDDREAQTLALLNKFKTKIAAAKETEESKAPGDQVTEEEGEVDEENPSSISWLGKALHSEKDELALAKDANRKGDDWFEIYDPRNPLNKRRREADASRQQEKIKKFKPIG